MGNGLHMLHFGKAGLAERAHAFGRSGSGDAADSCGFDGDTLGAGEREIASGGNRPGKIELDLYHLVWIFAVCCVFGLVGETVVSFFVDGRWEDRAGFLWGPFSPIYGVGGVLMTVALARLDDAPSGVLFASAAFVGAAFEWFAGWFWENAFGIVAWDYSSQPFNIGGHTCLGIALVWGAAGVAWVKFALPAMQRAADAVPVAWRAVFTWGLLAFFLLDTAMTFLAFDCWMNRLAGVQPIGAVQAFFANHYGDAFMQGRFQTMSMYPSLAGLRG